MPEQSTQRCYRCLRCSELFCSATRQNLWPGRETDDDTSGEWSGCEPQNASISQSDASLTIHAQPMHTDSSVRAESMLGRATVLQTARMKPDLEARFVTLLRDATAQRAGAEELADKRPSCETRQRASAAGRWLWVLKGRTAFVPMAQRRRGGAAEIDEAEVDEMTTKYLQFQKCFWKRLQKAEMGFWEELLQQYTHELATTQSSGQGVFGSHLSRLVSR